MGSTRQRMSWSHIPCIDISPILNDPQSSDARTAARQFSQAAKTYGFVTVENHGIESTLIDSVVSQADLFFQTDQSYRNQFIVNNEDYGYFPASRDGKEGLDIRIRGISWPDPVTGSYEGVMDNKMPETLPNFETTIRSYMTRVSKLGAILLECIATENNFGDAFSKIMVIEGGLPDVFFGPVFHMLTKSRI